MSNDIDQIAHMITEDPDVLNEAVPPKQPGQSLFGRLKSGLGMGAKQILTDAEWQLIPPANRQGLSAGLLLSPAKAIQAFINDIKSTITPAIYAKLVNAARTIIDPQVWSVEVNKTIGRASTSTTSERIAARGGVGESRRLAAAELARREAQAAQPRKLQPKQR